jgi:hypothetical protein
VHGAHAAPLELALEPEVEIGRVDTDEQRHAFGEQPSPERATNAKQLGQMRDHLDEAAHGELLEREPGFAAGRFHFRSRRCRQSARAASARARR